MNVGHQVTAATPSNGHTSAHATDHPRNQHLDLIPLAPSPLRPDVPSAERIFAWHGTRNPPAAVTPAHPFLTLLAGAASSASLKASTLASYGAGLRKFHVFCDIFGVAEDERMPASFELLHSFVLWATADADILDDSLREAAEGIPLEPISVSAASKYLDAVRAWHVVQGWEPPISEPQRMRLNWTMRGIANLQASRRSRPPRPPISLHMLAALKAALDLGRPFDACLWALAASAFWGLMRFGEVTVKSRGTFSTAHHLARKHALFGVDLDGRPYARLDLPSAKTAKAGEVQHVFLVRQNTLCPLEALRNLASVVPAGADDPLFSWRDVRGDIRPMTRELALRAINDRFRALGLSSTFGHSFRIGGASFLLSQGVDPEVVRLMGRWKSLAYEVYIRAFEQVASRHTENLAANYGW